MLPRTTLDFEVGVMRLDGLGVQPTSIPQGFQEADVRFRYMTLDLERDEMLIGLPDRHDVVVELGVVAQSAQAALKGRPVIYLDQNHWSALAAWRYGHRRVPASEAAAAEILLEKARDRQVVLPFSGSHLVETGPMYNERRTYHASTLLEYSRGWQMLNPVEIRRHELQHALGVSQQEPLLEAFNLDSDGVFATALRPPNASGLPAALSAAFQRLVNVSSIYSAIIDPQAIPDEGGRAMAEAWAQKFTDIGLRLRADQVSSENVRKVAHANMLLDIGPEIERLAEPEQVRAWVARSDSDVSAMPYLARYRAVIFARFRNATSPWVGNDLLDLAYLCSAAGYADVVVGEKRTIGDLRNARDLPRGAALTTSLSEALAVLE